MRAAVVLAVVLVAQLPAWSDDLTPDQLSAAVDAEDVATLRAWLTPKRVASDDAMPQIAEVFIEALNSRKAEVVALIFQAGLQWRAIESDALDQAVYDVAVANDEGILDLLQKNGWTPQLAFAKSLASRTTNEEQDYGPAETPFIEGLISASLDERNVRFLRLCLDTGLSPNFRLSTSRNESLLNESIKVSSLPAFKLLVEHGASLTEVRDIDQFKTTLAIAIELQGEQSPYVALLKQKGADRLRYMKPRPNIAQSTTDRLRIRSSPGLSGVIVGYLMEGEVVELLEVSPLSSLIDGITAPWIRIRQGKTQGWVFGGYLNSFQPDGQS